MERLNPWKKQANRLYHRRKRFIVRPLGLFLTSFLSNQGVLGSLPGYRVFLVENYSIVCTDWILQCPFPRFFLMLSSEEVRALCWPQEPGKALQLCSCPNIRFTETSKLGHRNTWYGDMLRRRALPMFMPMWKVAAILISERLNHCSYSPNSWKIIMRLKEMYYVTQVS